MNKNLKKELQKMSLSDLKYISKDLGISSSSGSKKSIINKLLQPFSRPYRMENLPPGIENKINEYLPNCVSKSEILFKFTYTPDFKGTLSFEIVNEDNEILPELKKSFNKSLMFHSDIIGYSSRRNLRINNSNSVTIQFKRFRGNTMQVFQSIEMKMYMLSQFMMHYYIEDVERTSSYSFQISTSYTPVYSQFNRQWSVYLCKIQYNISDLLSDIHNRENIKEKKQISLPSLLLDKYGKRI